MTTEQSYTADAHWSPVLYVVVYIRQSQTLEVSDFKKQFYRNRLSKPELSRQSYYIDLVWVLCVRGYAHTHELSHSSIPHATSWSLYV